MVKIVINGNYGGFSLNDAILAKAKALGINDWDTYSNHPSRTSLQLISILESLPESERDSLVIEELPEGTEFFIEEYDGLENIVLKSELQWSIAKQEP